MSEGMIGALSFQRPQEARKKNPSAGVMIGPGARRAGVLRRAAVKARPVRFMRQVFQFVSLHQNGPMSTYLLWDIDGTLIYNNPQAGSLYADSIEQVTGIRPTTRVPNPHGMTEGQLLAAILELNGIDEATLPAVFMRLDELSTRQHESGETRERCMGVADAIAVFAGRGWTNALLTGNGPIRARYKVIAAGLNPDHFDWTHSYFGQHSPTRHHLTAHARADLGDDSAFIIGDTPTDGEAADSAGIPFIAVATGAFTAPELRQTSALVVIENFEVGLADVLGVIERRAPADNVAYKTPV